MRRVLEDKVVFVSGGTSGIGKVSALMMAEAGATVAIGGLRRPECQAVADEIAARGGKAAAVELDVRLERSATEAIGTTVAAFGRIDALFNPAGILKQAPVATCSPSEWDEVVGVHAGGHANVLSAVIPVMRAQGTGRIITVSSGAAIDGIGELAAYATAKSAILGMTRALAPALANDGITINSISPTAYTPMSRDVPPGEDSPIPARFRRRASEQVAAFVSYLASDLSEGVTGRLFMVSGGHTIEFDPPRPLKQIELCEDATVETVRDDLAWIQRRPTATTIGRRPTRDYFVLGGLSGGPEPMATADEPASGPLLLVNVPAKVADRLASLQFSAAKESQPISGAVLCPQNPDSNRKITDVAAAWHVAAPIVRDVFLKLQAAARRLAGPGTIIVALPRHTDGAPDLVGEIVSAALLGLARSAASSLASSGISVHAIQQPEDDGDASAFALLTAALVGNTVVTSGGIFGASRGHVVSFVPEMPAWQHFGDAELTDAWLGAVDTAVRSRGARWSAGTGS